jgi:hypothetical protein
MVMEIPADSIYFWMYKQGLRHVNINSIILECQRVGKVIRPKDLENYWNGYYNSDLYHNLGKDDIFMLTRSVLKQKEPDFFSMYYDAYPLHPYIGKPEVENRWVPCNIQNKPMIKWGKGCMSMADAVAYKDQVYLAENLKGTKMIVIDCDGNHGETLDMETMCFLNQFRSMTHTIIKPCDDEIPASFHLTFKVDRTIPTMHFPYAHIDIVGNQRNSLRYWKNKQWNGMDPAPMNSEIWSSLQRYIGSRKEKANG